MTEGSAKVGWFFYTWAIVSVLGATCTSFYTIFLHLKNYRRPDLQRLTIRILIMVPIYSIASLISLSSHNLAFYVNTIRDIYEAFVIYSFFILLINYLDGEKEIFKLLATRLRIHHLWPMNYCLSPLDMSDPFTFLKIKQGVLQFVIVKPIVGILIMILKAQNVYDEGYIAWGSSYLWLSLIYNVSVCTALYCLVMFYQQCSKDLKPYRPVPKFICVKGIIFVTFWQGLFLAILTWGGLIQGGEYSKDNISQAIQDTLLCIEMPIFGWMHYYAFPWTDYDDDRLSSRLQFVYALRDCLGVKDIIFDTKSAFGNFLDPWLQRHGEIYLEEEGVPFRHRGDQVSYSSHVNPIEFEIDETAEEDYKQSKQLTYGDFRFPVIHDDWRHPPDVQQHINRNANQFYTRLQDPVPILEWDDE